MSDTPETDAAVIASGGDWSPVLRAVAQRLERERDEAREAFIEARTCDLDRVLKAIRERNEARDWYVTEYPNECDFAVEPECHDFGHTKEERHAFLEECPVMARYDALIAQAKEAAK